MAEMVAKVVLVDLVDLVEKVGLVEDLVDKVVVLEDQITMLEDYLEPVVIHLLKHNHHAVEVTG